MILISGQNLQRRYSTTSKSNILTNSQITQQKNDHNALREASKKKRVQREARQQLRMEKNMSPEKALQVLEDNPTKDINVKAIQEKAKSQTNVLARKYGLAEPDNQEALNHDRLHCFTCDRKLDSPNAHKQENGLDSLFDDEEIRLMCCWCFGKMGDDQIKSTIRTDDEATSEIRLKVYNPEESTKAEIESLIGFKKIQLKSKLKKWKQDVSLVGNIKHDYLFEGDQIENSVLYNAKTRYNACTL